MRVTLITIFIALCIGCIEQNQHIFGSSGDPNLSSFERIGSYSIDSFAFAFTRSSLFTENLSKEKSKIFSLSSLFLSDYLENRIAEALNLTFRRAEGFRIEYMTADPYEEAGQTKASGLALIPSSKKPLPLLVFLHPTLLNKDEAPGSIPPVLLAMDPITDYRLMMIFLALQGYIVFAPDYIGYGSSKDMIHPYLHKKSVIQTTGNLLRAVEQALRESETPFKRELFIMGYSQGGHGALAFAEALQNSSMDFKIQAVAAGGGPYDMLYTVKEYLNKDSAWNFVLALLLQSYSHIYNWNLDDIVRKQDYADIIYDLRKHDSLSRAVRDLPDRISDLFRPAFIRDVLKKDGRTDYQAHLEENNVYDWDPDFPTLLFHAKKDKIVPYRNMDRAYRSFKGRGARISRQDCSFKKVRDLVDIIEKAGEEMGLRATPDHIICTFIFFLEAGEYFFNLRY